MIADRKCEGSLKARNLSIRLLPRFGRVLKRLTKVGVLVLLGLAALVFTHASVASIRYNVPLSDALKESLRQGGLAVIGALVQVYDPCTPRVATTGPGADDRLDATQLARIEVILPIGQTIVTADGHRITTREVQNERIVRSPYTFHYQPYDEPRLHELRRRYHLDDVVAGAVNDFAAIVRLRTWTRAQFKRQDYQPFTSTIDALEVLDRNWRDHGETYSPDRHIDPCKLFPYLYSQVVLSMGHQARLVSVNHGLVEVWSNHYRKWVAMDAELDLHYMKDDTPLNMIDLLEENYSSGPTRVHVVCGERLPGGENTTLVHLGCETLEAWRLVKWFNTHLDLVEMRNDWVTNRYFRGHPACSEGSSLVYADPRVKEPLDFWHRLRPVTSNKSEFYWTLNQAEILASRPTGRTLELGFRTFTPNFESYEILVDSQAPVPCRNSTFRWELREGVNTIAVRPVNRFGVRGIESVVRLAVADS